MEQFVHYFLNFFNNHLPLPFKQQTKLTSCSIDFGNTGQKLVLFGGKITSGILQTKIQRKVDEEKNKLENQTCKNTLN